MIEWYYKQNEEPNRDQNSHRRNRPDRILRLHDRPIHHYRNALEASGLCTLIRSGVEWYYQNEMRNPRD